MPEIELRPYQAANIAEISSHFRQGQRRVLYVAPTGSGKSYTFGAVVQRALARGKRVYVLLHRQELVDQTSQLFTEFATPHGFIAASYPERDRPLQIASIQTLARRLGRYPAPDFAIVDEAHHIAAKSWAAILDAWLDTFVMGSTATPERLDGRGLGKHFGAMVLGPPVAELIQQGYLSDYRIFAPPAPSLAGVHTVAGEYNVAEQAEIVDKPQLVGDVVEHYLRIAPNTQAVCFGVNVRHSEHLAAAFRAAGVAAVHVDGETDADVRRQAMADFAARKWRVFCNVGLIGEGVDIAGIETVIVGRETKSLSNWLQWGGRALRPQAGKVATIIYHGSNLDDLGGFDEPRAWTLDDAAKRAAKPREIATKTCPVCFLVVPAASRMCGCGHEFRPDTELPEPADGELVDRGRGRTEDELAADMARQDHERSARKREEWACKTLDDWRALAERRGYKPGWAFFRWQQRQAKMARRGAA